MFCRPVINHWEARSLCRVDGNCGEQDSVLVYDGDGLAMRVDSDGDISGVYLLGEAMG